MAGAAIAAVDLVGDMKMAENLFLRMKKAAEDAEKLWTVPIANDNSWATICIQYDELGILTFHRYADIGSKIEIYQKMYDDYSRNIRNLKNCVALLRRDDSTGKLPKNKIKLEYIVKEEQITIYETSSPLEERIVDEITKKITELNTTKQDLVVVRKILKFLKDASHLCDKAIDSAKQMLILRVRAFQSKIVEVVGKRDAETIKRIYELRRFGVKGGAVTLKFAIGRLVRGEPLEYICAEINKLSKEISDFNAKHSKPGEDYAEISKLNEVAVDVKPGDLYQLSFDTKGLCHFCQLTPVDAPP